MNNYGAEDKEKARKDRAKKAVALAMKSEWEAAAALNQSILKDFAEDLEAYNRLGKALSELGHNAKAREAFQRALEISPHNTIARKNLGRLSRLGDESPTAGSTGSVTPDLFIEESGKAALTSLINLGSPDVLLKLAPGHALQPQVNGGGLKVVSASGDYVGQVEPRIASRLTRLIKGGNRYKTTVTSVGEGEVVIIIREAYKDPSQAGVVSFPSRGGVGYGVYLPSALLSYDVGEAEAEDMESAVVKDWSNDDTEPGDDEAFSPVLHRIINAGEEPVREGDDNF